MDALKADTPKAKILVVDDEPNILLTLTAILQHEGYEIESATGGEEAIASVRRHHYDVVLTDLKMPRVDGLDVLDEVRRSSPQTVTLMMTGYAALDSAVEAVQRGAYEYLMKPVEIADLKLAVQRSLERKRLSESETLYRVQKNLAVATSEEEIAREVAEAACKVLNVDHAFLFLTEGSNPNAEVPVPPAPHDAEIIAALRSGNIFNSTETFSASAWAHAHGIADLALIPGIAQDELVCVLCVHNGADAYEFHASALRFLRSLASHAALVLRNRQLIGELQHNNAELAEANRKLKELDRLKSQFLSIATHELRTPLSVILGYNSLLAESLEDRLTAEENETLEESAVACKRLIRLVNSMLDITQIESGKMQMSFAPADARQIVLAVERLFRHEAEQRGIALHVHVPARLPRTLLDAERMQQVMINLVGNALKFTPAGGQVAMSVRQVTPHLGAEAGSLAFTVQDTGIGIAPEDQKLIFDEFAQIRGRKPGLVAVSDAQPLNSGDNRGFGLGLAITRRIVQAHHGTLSVNSKLGRGSTFSALIPVRRAQIAAEQSSLSA
ncbi:MAG TPA: response regulator, partial [Terriglobales bacterium]|nr:response regulator [Terriglobales bacterium]